MELAVESLETPALTKAQLAEAAERLQRIRAKPQDGAANEAVLTLLAQALGLTETVPFTTYRGVAIGASGALEVPRDQLVKTLATQLRHQPLLIPGGPEVTRRVGIITGGAGTSISEAHRAGIDTYITGEGPHHTFHDAMELGINLIYAGHYATEQSGVQAVAVLLNKSFQLSFTYHDHPTGL